MSGKNMPVLLSSRKYDKQTYYLTEDLPRYRYVGYMEAPSFCRLRTFDPLAGETGPIIVMFSELPDNPGTSITNRVERLASMMLTRLDRSPSEVVFLEHYPDRSPFGRKAKPGSLFAEHFSRVTFAVSEPRRVSRPDWKRLSAADLISVGLPRLEEVTP